MKKLLISLLAAFAVCDHAAAGQTDILNPPPMPSGGWGLANTPIGQSFNAVASDVTFGLYVADQETYSQALQAWAATCSPYCGVSAWNSNVVVSPQIQLTATLYEGEGTGGNVIYRTPTPIVLNKPFNGIASIDLGASGVFLTVGQQYTMMFQTVNGTGTYWQTFSTIDRVNVDTNPTTGLPDPNLNHGAYYGGWAYINGVQQNPDANIGDVAFQVIDNNPQAPVPVMPACQGSSAIAQSLTSSKLFMVLANGQKVAYSNVYGSQGTTVFTFSGGITSATAFDIGNIVTYTGVLDASTICVPDTLSISPAPVVVPPAPTCGTGEILQGNVCVTAPVTCSGSDVLDPVTNTCITPVPAPTPVDACVKPSGSKKAEGHAKITAVGINNITVGSTVVFFADCTIREMNGGATGFAIGQDAEYKGFKSNGNITATKITIN